MRSVVLPLVQVLQGIERGGKGPCSEADGVSGVYQSSSPAQTLIYVFYIKMYVL